MRRQIGVSQIRGQFLIVMAICVSVAWPAIVVAGGGPENVVVVVNEQSASSKLIANYYVSQRQIPSRNVIYLKGIPNRETTSLDVFREKILVPVFTQIRNRGLQRSVDCVVYSADFPTSIGIHSHRSKLFEEIKQQSGRDKVVNAKLYGPSASINSLTYFAIAVLGDQVGYMALDANSYYRLPASRILSRPFVGPQQKKYADAIKALPQGSGEDFDKAIVTLEALAKKNPAQGAVCYSLARFYGYKGDVRATVNWLSRAVQNGWVYRSETQQDKAFEKVRLNSLYRGIEERIPDDTSGFLPSRGFKHSRAWAPNGMVNQELGQGNNLMLSTVLAVTRNFGTTEQEALDRLKMSIDADESNPVGTFYFSVAGGVRNTTRKAQIAPTIATLRSMGKRAEAIKTNLPKNKQDIVGLFTGAAKFDFSGSGGKILPGSICDHLTSFGGRLAVPGQTKLSEFILNGAAGASGTVTEPFALAAKFPHAMMHVHYARGCSLAEAFYQSVHGPFQLLIVGDALCQPYAVRPVINLKGVIDGQSVTGKVNIQIDVSRSPVPVSMVELYIDGVLFFRANELRPLDFDTTRLSDGHHELRAVVTANNLIETNGHEVVSFNVNNHGHETRLTCQRKVWDETEDVVFTVNSNFGETINIIQNMRSLGQASGQVAEFSIPAKAFGRGPVRVEALATSADKKVNVGSRPLLLEIEGRIATTKENTEKPKPKAPRRKS